MCIDLMNENVIKAIIVHQIFDEIRKMNKKKF